MATEKKKIEGMVILKDVRLSYAWLYKKQPAFGGEEKDEGELKYSLKALMEKDTETGEANRLAVRKMMSKMAKDKWPNGVPKLKDEKKCIRDGDDEDGEEYQNMWYVPANSGDRFPIVNRSRKPVKEGDSQSPYSGCYANVAIRIWCQDNKWGKRINAEIASVQFLRDGEAFGRTAVNPDDVFEDVSDENDDLDESFEDDGDLL
jgi:hypothetical protein